MSGIMAQCVDDTKRTLFKRISWSSVCCQYDEALFALREPALTSTALDLTHHTYDVSKLSSHWQHGEEVMDSRLERNHTVCHNHPTTVGYISEYSPQGLSPQV